MCKEDPDLAKYLMKRAKVTEADIRLHLREVNFHCPLCGEDLQKKNSKKRDVKLFEIAHIYPNSPTIEQYEELKGLERLGNNSESFDNKIALCKNCHKTQDFHTTKEEYLNLLNKKKEYLNVCVLNEVTEGIKFEETLEKSIEMIIDTINNDDSLQLSELNYNAVPIDKKFGNSNKILKAKVKAYVLSYYTLIRKKISENVDSCNFNKISRRVRNCFEDLNDHSDDRGEIFNALVEWLNNKTLNKSREACEVIISFYIQECEVFNEITK